LRPLTGTSWSCRWGVVTVGCRRCGGGLAGDTWVSNVLEGLSLAEARRPELVVCDGSGAAVPPVAADARVLVASALQGTDLLTGYLNAYRIMISDLVVLTMAGEDAGEVCRRIEEVKRVPVIVCDLRLRPLEQLRGRRAAVFTAGPAATDHLDAEVVHASTSLADRATLREELEGVDAEVYLVEIKAAGIDVVAETARSRGAEVVFADNEPVARAGEPDLEAELRALVELAVRERAAA
jgi:cyclic 2,3-diphosphoglycerate synthetase